MAPIEQEKGLEIIDETFDSQSFNVREVMEKFAESGFYNQILVNKIVTFFDKPNKTHLDQKLIGILKDRINLNL